MVGRICFYIDQFVKDIERWIDRKKSVVGCLDVCTRTYLLFSHVRLPPSRGRRLCRSSRRWFDANNALRPKQDANFDDDDEHEPSERREKTENRIFSLSLCFSSLYVSRDTSGRAHYKTTGETTLILNAQGKEKANSSSWTRVVWQKN